MNKRDWVNGMEDGAGDRNPRDGEDGFADAGDTIQYGSDLPSLMALAERYGSLEPSPEYDDEVGYPEEDWDDPVLAVEDLDSLLIEPGESLSDAHARLTQEYGPPPWFAKAMRAQREAMGWAAPGEYGFVSHPPADGSL